MLPRFRADLHIHTCLSPCGAPESVPTRIVAESIKHEIDIIAVCDHNASENALSVRKAAVTANLTVYGGMEITSQEEIHVLAIFDDLAGLESLQTLVYRNLPGSYDGTAFGQQYLVDEEDYVIGYNEHLLMGATNLSIDRIVEEIHLRQGLAIAAHVDRGAFSLISQLGFIPEGIPFDALEISASGIEGGFSLEGTSIAAITSSDAHHPDEIGRGATDFYLEAPGIDTIRAALKEKSRSRYEVVAGI